MGQFVNTTSINCYKCHDIHGGKQFIYKDIKSQIN